MMDQNQENQVQPQVKQHQEVQDQNSSSSSFSLPQLDDHALGESEEKDKPGKSGQMPLSKKQLKKQLKKGKWEEAKKIKRKEQRQKEKERRRQKRETVREEMMEKGQCVEEREDGKMGRKRKEEYMEKMVNGVRVVIDLQFYDLMTEKEQGSLGKQLAYCHSVNRKSARPFNFVITSLTEQRREFMCQKYSIGNYGIDLQVQGLLALFPKDKIVYLTGDAEDEMQEFDPSEVYIIGGIVDHNRLRNITIDFARQHGLKARRLPMSGLKLKASVHLAVNHVWEWMLRHYNGSTWKESIKAVIPERKLQEAEKGV